MSTLTPSPIAEIPPSNRIHFIQQVLTRHKRWFERSLRGTERGEKQQELDTCLDSLVELERKVKYLQGIERTHKEMCARMADAARRHGLVIGGDYLDKVIITGLDKAMDAAGSALPFLEGMLDGLRDAGGCAGDVERDAISKILALGFKSHSEIKSEA